jgi:hypothetical protein
MDAMQKELEELKTFIAELKADRATQKEKEKREAWTKHTSLSLVMLAVLAAVATQWGAKFSSRTLVNLNDSTFHQAKASDQWSYYQAKSIKQTLFEMGREQLTRADGATPTPTATPVAAQFDKIDSKIAKYEKDKKEIQTQAEALEKQRDAARAAAGHSSHQGAEMGLAVSIYQIAIAMGSICLVVKKRPLWYLGLLFAVFATAQMIYAFFS